MKAVFLLLLAIIIIVIPTLVFAAPYYLPQDQSVRLHIAKSSFSINKPNA